MGLIWLGLPVTDIAHADQHTQTGTTGGRQETVREREEPDPVRRPPRQTTPRQTGITAFVPIAPPVVTAPTPRRATPPRAVPRPDRARREIVVLDISPEDLTTLEDQGFEIIESVVLEALGITHHRLRVPRPVSDTDALEIVRALPSGPISDFNHFYRAGQGDIPLCEGVKCAARVMIGWPVEPTRAASCGTGVTLGMIDSAVNTEHSTFEGAALEVMRLTREGLRASRPVHGTAVASQLIGDPASRSPGLVPGARLVAVDAFFRDGRDERADVHGLAEGLDILARNEARVINLSLAGSDNRVLARLVEKLTGELDVVIVAAVGNAGPKSAPQFPAGYADVLAVTAIDRNRALYTNAVRGDHVDLAAPGVEVWTAASLKGATWRTGTSYAAPFVTAAVAMLRQAQPDLSVEQITEALRDDADDLGDPGADALFGAGLLRISDLCAVEG